jgi:hypothetical protein
MSKILKYVPVIFLWLAGLTLSAHMLIPHDHHLDDTYSSRESNCTDPCNKSDNSPVFPVHCHAFNDLASEKLRLYQISQDIQLFFVASGVIPDTDKPVSDKSCVRVIDFQKPVFVTYALESALLRAPPFVA